MRPIRDEFIILYYYIRGEKKLFRRRYTAQAITLVTVLEERPFDSHKTYYTICVYLQRGLWIYTL